MFKYLNKGISTPIAIIIIVVCALLVGGIVVYQYYGIPKEEEETPGEKLPEDETTDLTEKEQACLNYGGTVSTSMCCKTTDDFPNLCLIGPCGCSPENSHEVKICDCGPGKCFDGEKCIEEKVSEDETADWKTYEDISRGFSFKYPSSWTYQNFSCNVDGVAFCPIRNGLSGCGQTCGTNGSSSPIYLYSYQGQPAIAESQDLKYWADPNISLNLRDSKYREIYIVIVSTFKFIQ